MAIETKKENIFSTTAHETQSIQIPLQEDVIVPDIKPDMEHILQWDARVMFDDMKIEGNRVKFSGKVDCYVLYLSEGPNKSVHNLSTSFNIDDYINVDESEGEALYYLDGYIDNMRIEKLNSRKLNINCILDVKAMTETKNSNSIITDALGGTNLQTKKAPFETRQMVLNKEEKFIVKDEINVPQGKANINEVLWCDLHLKNKEIKVLDDKITVKGDLLVCMLYSGEGEGQQLEFLEKEIPFNGIVEAYGCTPDMFTDARMNVSKYYVQVMPDLDGEDRIVEIEAIVELKIKVYSMEQRDVIVDLYEPNKHIHKKCKKNKFQNIVCMNSMRSNVCDTITLGQEMPDMMQVLYGKATCKVEDIEVKHHHVLCEGVVFVKMYYVGADDNNPLCSYDQVIPFQQEIDCRGAMEGMTVEINCDVEHVMCNMLSKREVEVRCMLCLDVAVIDEKEMELIVELEEEDMPMEELELLPSVVIYVVQKGDTLWSIAKKYNTTVAELMALNDLESDVIDPGDKILVVKKLVEY